MLKKQRKKHTAEEDNAGHPRVKKAKEKAWAMEPELEEEEEHDLTMVLGALAALVDIQQDLVESQNKAAMELHLIRKQLEKAIPALVDIGAGVLEVAAWTQGEQSEEDKEDMLEDEGLKKVRKGAGGVEDVEIGGVK